MSGCLTFLAFLLLGHISTVDVAEIKDAVNHYILSRLDSTLRKDAIVEFRGGLEPMSIAGTEHTVRVGLDQQQELRGSVCLPVEIASEGKVWRQLVVSVKIRLFGQVFVADQQLERHSSASDEAISPRYVELTSLPEDIVTNKEQLAGKRTSRIIGAGSVIRESSLELIPLVYREEPVTLVIIAGHVRLSTQALAKEDGVFGSTIEVQRTDSHERIRAVVIDEHTVEVTTE